MITDEMLKAAELPDDHPAVIKAKQAGKDFCNSLLELDAISAGKAATGMGAACARIADKVAMLAALQAMTKAGITQTPLRELMKRDPKDVAADITANEAALAGATVH